MLRINIVLVLIMVAFINLKAADGFIQLINLSPDTSLNLVEVSIGNEILISSLAFNEASAYLAVPEGDNQTLTFKSVNNLGIEFQLENINITASSFYQSILTGVLNPDDYTPNPNNISLEVKATFNLVDNSNIPIDKIRVNFFNAISDAVKMDVLFKVETIVPLLDPNGMVTLDSLQDTVYITLADSINIEDDMSFGQYSDLSTDLNIATTVFYFLTFDSITTFLTKSIDLETINGQTLTILLSGFIVSDNNNNGPNYGLYAVDESGNVILLDIVSEVFSQEIVQDISIGPNPAKDFTYIRFNNIALDEIGVFLIDLSGKRIQLSSINTIKGYNQIKLEIPQVPTGLYFLQLESQGSGQSFPLIIER